MLTRAAFLAKGGLGLAAVGGLGGLPATAAATLPDGDLATLRLLLSTELLGDDFYTTALRAQPYGSRGEGELQLARANERRHYSVLAGILTDAGEVPLTAADIDVAYPTRTFATTENVTKTAVALESIFLGAYLGATAAVQTPSLVQPLAQIAASQAQHLSVFEQLRGRPGLTAAFPPALSIDAASGALAAYTQ
jgi:hypothetical protein